MPNTPHPGAGRPRPMSQSDFANWGLPQLAFIKRIMVDDAVGWSIHAADGTQVGLAPSRDLAFAAVRQHELEPGSGH